jgi:para-nitrobenzyl esterase
MTTNSQVRTGYGILAGSRRPAGTVYRSVPYAAPVSGATRFAAPRSPRPWAGVRQATDVGPTAPAAQRHSIGSLDVSALIGPGWRRGDEYLTLNVWTPGTSGDTLPVLVFVHGGGFVSGSHSADVLAGDAFMADGVVLVAVSYRLGIPGWLDLPGAPANRGLLDVVAALRWVRAEISAFGGDPDRVTVAGQSAGGMIVAGLLACPPATGLFGRAIIASGNADNAQPPSMAARVARAAARDLRVDLDAAAFGAVSDAELVAAAQRLDAHDLGIPDRGVLPGSVFGLVLDRETLPQQPLDAVRVGSCHPVDLLVSSTTDEAHLYLVPTGSSADEEEAARTTEAMFGASSRRLADAHAQDRRGKTFRHQFTWRSDAFDGRLGACHCVDLPYVFGTADQPALHGPAALLGTTPPDQATARAPHRHWVDFARTGDPGWAEHGLVGQDRITHGRTQRPGTSR